MNKKNSDKVFRLLFVLAFLLSLASMPNRVATAQVYPPGMVSYWKFDEGSGGIAGDSIGGNNGIIYGATWTTGQVGGGLSFDGVDDYVNIGNVESLNFERTDTFSIEVWIRISKGDTNIISKMTPDTRGWGFQVVSDNSIPYPNLMLSNTWFSNAMDSRSLTPLSGTDFDHVVVTYDGSSSAEGISLYINSELTEKVSHRDWLTDSIRTEHDVNIGSRYPGFMHFQGEMDELAVYSRVLSTEEIQQHYQNGLMGLGYETSLPANQPPVADAGGPYTVEWGAALTLDGSGSTDPDNNIASYEWDLNADGVYDVAGVTTITSFTQIGDHPVTLRVTDDGGLSDTDTATVTVPIPSFSAFPAEDYLNGHNWPIGETLFIEVDDPVTPANPDYTGQVSDWDPNVITFQMINFSGQYDMKPGDIVTVTQGTTIKTHRVTDFAITQIDIDTDIVSGWAEPGSDIVSWVCDDYGCAERFPTANQDGSWSANFSILGNSPADWGTYDFKPGTGVEASQADEDGDKTVVGWNLPIPIIEAIGTNQLAGSGWPLGLAVTMTIDDPTNGEGVDYTVIQMPFEEPWQPEGSLRVPIPVDYFLKPGYIVQATNGEITKTLVYTHLEVTQVDIATETVYGVSDPDANIYVRIHDGDVHLDVTADNNGDWVADFQGIYNLTPTTRGQVRQTDSDGDSTVQFFGSPVMYVYLIDDLIQGLNWKLGAYVTFTIDDPQNGPGVDLTETKIVEVAWWNPNETEIGFATDTLGIRPGQQMVMTDGVTTITHIVSRLEITVINSTANTVAGITNPGSVVEVGRMCDESGCAFRRVTANSDGDWLADFSVPGEDSDEQDLFDIRPGTRVDVDQKDNYGNVDTITLSVSDNQPPTANAGPDIDAYISDTITLDASASSDPEAGLLTYAWDLDNDGEYDVTGVTTTTSFNQIGEHIIGLRVTDDGGLSDTDTVTVAVLPWTLKGFYQPVDMSGVYNLVKGGSTVPLKFEIFAGITELTDIAYVKSLTYAQTSCDANANTDEIETTATGGTSLRYADGHFIYNWKTPKSAGMCYRVTMTTIDGSTLMAYFKLK